MQQDDRFRMFSENDNRTAVIIGTGPSLTIDQLSLCSHIPRFGVNNAFMLGLDVHLACNWQWWDEYWQQIKNDPCDKWTPRKESADKYGINYIEEVWIDGLSTDKTKIAAHHGSGPQIVNIALHYGVKRMLLIGWDMRYPDKVSDKQYKSDRHYFGEYPAKLQHFPRTGAQGELEGLMREMETIDPDDYGIEIINCTPNSAMTCFPMMSLEDALCLT